MNILISKGETAPMKMKMKMKMKTRKHNLKKVLLLLPLFLAFIGLHCQEANAAGSITLTGSIDCIAPHGENPNLVCGGEATTTGVTTSSRVTLELSWQVDNPTALVFNQDPVGSQTNNYMTLTIGDGDIEITNADIPDLYDGLVEASFVDGVLVSFTINDTGWTGVYIEDSNDLAYSNDWLIDLAGDSTTGDANIQFEFQEQLGVVGDWFQGHINFPDTSNDFNGDGWADILLRHTDGSLRLLLMNEREVKQDAILTALSPDWTLLAKADFNDDRITDILVRNTDGVFGLFLMSSDGTYNYNEFKTLPLFWEFKGTGDFNGDGKADILVQKVDENYAQHYVMLMDGNTISAENFTATHHRLWDVAGLGDSNNDGKTDIFLRRTDNGSIALLVMNGLTKNAKFITLLSPTWEIIGTEDFNGDGMAEILVEQAIDSDLRQYLFEIDGNLSSSNVITNQGSISRQNALWHITGFADFNNDSKMDILLRRTDNGSIALWEMDGLDGIVKHFVTTLSPIWTIIDLNDFNGDGMADILLQKALNGTTNQLYMFPMNGGDIIDTNSGTVTNLLSEWSLQ